MKKLKQKKIDHLKGSCKKMQADKKFKITKGINFLNQGYIFAERIG